jgi:hypothetical protein
MNDKTVKLLTDFPATAMELIKGWQSQGYDRFYVNGEVAGAHRFFDVQIRDLAPGPHQKLYNIPSAKEEVRIDSFLAQAVIEALICQKLKAVKPKPCLMTLRS